MATEMSAQMKSYREIGQQAALAEEASAKSAADAKTAAEQAAAVRADLQSKQSKLQVQIAVVKSQYTGADPEPARGPGRHAADAAAPPAPDAAATGERSRRLWPRRRAASRRATWHRPAASRRATGADLPGRRAPPSSRPR